MLYGARLWLVTIIVVVPMSSYAETNCVLRWTVVEHDIVPSGNVAAKSYIDTFSFNRDEFTTIAGNERATTKTNAEAIFQTILGTKYFVSYRRTKSAIVKIDRFPGFIVKKFVYVSNTSCFAKIIYLRIPGKSLFESKRDDGNGPSSAFKIDVENIQCNLS